VTRERIELELMRIKQDVSPEHRGIRGVTYEPSSGETCIQGELLKRLNGTNRYAWGDEWRSWSEEIREFVQVMIKQNDGGVPWHEIINLVIPAEVQAAYLKQIELEKTEEACLSSK
jgi:hypothetical protein